MPNVTLSYPMIPLGNFRELFDLSPFAPFAVRSGRDNQRQCSSHGGLPNLRRLHLEHAIELLLQPCECKSEKNFRTQFKSCWMLFLAPTQIIQKTRKKFHAGIHAQSTVPCLFCHLSV